MKGVGIEFTGDDLKDLRLQGRLEQQQAADHCGVCLKTYQRWEAGRHKIPPIAFKYLSIVALGKLPPGAHDWAGWRFIDGKLWDPIDNHAYTPGAIRAWFYVSQQLTYLQSRENSLAHQADRENVSLHPTAAAAKEIKKELYKRLVEAEAD